jgi:hypothetical protein
MRLVLFEKAKYFLDNKKIKVTYVDTYSISFQVSNFNVIGKYKNHQLIWDCDCKANTNGDLCSHKIAAQTYLVLNWPLIINYDMADKAEEKKNTKIELPDGLTKLSEEQKLVLRRMVCFKCQDCHKHEDEVGKLEVHRIKRGADGGLYIPQNIKMLCKSCHDIYDY